MTATTPAVGRPPSAAVGASEGGAVLPVLTRFAMWVAIQLLAAGVLVLSGTSASRPALNAVAAWWMVYAVLVDLATLGVVVWWTRRAGVPYRGLLGPPAAAWQVALGALAVLAVTVPAVVFGTEVNKAFYGEATLPMFAVVHVPAWAGAFTVLVAPVLTELAEPVAYLGVLLPWLERRTGRSWLAASIVVAVWATEHAFFPLLVRDGSLDLVFAGYRVVSVLPFLATWTALYFALGRRLLPVMVGRWVFNAGSALAVALGLMS